MNLFYSDGRLYDPPKNPLADKWRKLYPPTPMPQYSQVCDGYSCMYCGRCPSGEYWKVPEEDKEEYEKWSASVDKYWKENGGIGDLMLPINVD